MRSLNILGTISLVALSLTNCSKNETTASSDIKHLTTEMPNCAVDKDRADYLFANLGPYVHGDRNLSYYFMQQISMAPVPLTEYLVNRAKAGQFHIRFDLGNGYAGLTTGGFDQADSSLIQFPANYESVRQAALHEVGHAVQYHSFRLAGKPGSEMNDVQNGYANAVNREGQNMWSYARTNRTEWFASSFSHYFCSGPARDYMRSYYPNTVQFFDSLYSFLGQQPATQPSNPQPQGGVDSDGDGIADSGDYCPNTAAGAGVPTKGMFRGCASGQHTSAMDGSANGDDDRDGVINYFDRCPATPTGSSVHQSDEFRGCAGGQSMQDINRLIKGE